MSYRIYRQCVYCNRDKFCGPAGKYCSKQCSLNDKNKIPLHAEGKVGSYCQLCFQFMPWGEYRNYCSAACRIQDRPQYEKAEGLIFYQIEMDNQ